MSMQLFDKTAIEISRKIALNYSTSFSLGIKLLGPAYRDPVFSIYGFVRVADEIVDTFLGHDKERLLREFKAQTYQALTDGISTNPVLHAFQIAANKYQIGHDLIEPFFKSMEEDLDTASHSNVSYSEYIYGSAEVVGLMCLKVFCNGSEEAYNSLKPSAQSLGAAFQKVNFLRDMKSDFEDRGRVYFPSVDFSNFDDSDKAKIIQEIKVDFELAHKGILRLPMGCRLGVYTAYVYYLKLLEKIERCSAMEIRKGRIRIPNSQKLLLLAKSYVKEKRWQNAAL